MYAERVKYITKERDEGIEKANKLAAKVELLNEII